ncbi:PQQ-binding-like beta-propeller repeat protein [Mucilaginibacter sp.]|uniref:outer membrane protein assembly factor BamB family protein n=1 Tax=Mucilaginibacter sp. TaxID=1882438 RepID=UPI0035BC6BE0
MKIKSIHICVMVILSMVTIAGCKKDAPKTDTLAVAPLPDSIMFVNTFDSKSGTTIYLLNAVNGSLSTKYNYPADPATTWSYPVAGNGFLYSLQNNKINAIDMKTGAVKWTDAVDNAAVPVLHDQTFYGVYRDNTTFYVYALDATKSTKEYLWKYQVTGAPSLINYYNGVIYVSQDQTNLIALDANTGVLKWRLSTAYSLAALGDGIIMVGYTAVDASTGTAIGTIKPVAIPPAFGANTSNMISSLQYATKDFYYVTSTHFNNPPGLSKTFLSAIDRTGAEKWRIDYGGGQAVFDSSKYITQTWNNKLVIKKLQNTGAGKYGSSTTEAHQLINPTNGAIILKFDDDNKGATLSSYIANNTVYLHKRFESTLNGLPSTPPAANYLLTIDLLTGKQKWSNDKLVDGYEGAVSSCVYAGGKGFSPLIQ